MCVRAVQNSLNLLAGQLVWLPTVRHLYHGDRNLSRQALHQLMAGSPPGLVSIQHQNELWKALQQQLLLHLRKADSHQSHHVATTSLMDSEAVEESFHHDGALGSFPHGTMEIKDHL